MTLEWLRRLSSPQPRACAISRSYLVDRCGLVLTAILITACAKVADPLPPLVRIPDPVDFEIVQQARDRIELIIPEMPDQIREIEVYRECGKSSTEASRGCLLRRLRREDLRKYQVPGYYVFTDAEPSFEQACRYSLRVANEQKRFSVLSKAIQTDVLMPAAAPRNVAVEVREDRLLVSWDPPGTNLDGSGPPNVVGYLVNSIHFVSEPEFVDQGFRFGEPSSFRVQTVSRRAHPMVLSPFTDPLMIIPEDTFPPVSPGNLTAVSLGTRIQLLWDANGESDLAGYVLYRGLEPGQLEKLTPLIHINRYVDEAPPRGVVLHYSVTAVDIWGNESMPARSVTVMLGP